VDTEILMLLRLYRAFAVFEVQVLLSSVCVQTMYLLIFSGYLHVGHVFVFNLVYFKFNRKIFIIR